MKFAKLYKKASSYTLTRTANNRLAMLFLAIVIICVILTGCFSQNSVEIYGVYETSITSKINNEIGKYTLTLYPNKTYKYSILENYKSSEDSITRTYEGNIISIEDINKDIMEITLDNEDAFVGSLIHVNNSVVYKYKNLIGEYIPADIHRGDDFFIQDGEQAGSGEYFSTDGTMVSKNGYGVSSDKFRYKIESDIIWVEFSADYGYSPQYYIVDGGVFQRIFTKQE